MRQEARERARAGMLGRWAGAVLPGPLLPHRRWGIELPGLQMQQKPEIQTF